MRKGDGKSSSGEFPTSDSSALNPNKRLCELSCASICTIVSSPLRCWVLLRVAQFIDQDAARMRRQTDHFAQEPRCLLNFIFLNGEHCIAIKTEGERRDRSALELI